MKIGELYETDETGWLEQMARLIEKGRHEELDYQHLGEYSLRGMTRHHAITISGRRYDGIQTQRTDL
jgi:hypothetical protein